MKRRMILSYFLLLVSCFGIAQDHAFDSLKVLLVNAKEDSLRINILNDISGQFFSKGDDDSSLSYARRALSLSEHSYKPAVFKSGAATAYINIANVYDRTSNYAEALKAYFSSLEIRKEQKNISEIGSCYNDIGLVYYHQGNYPEALQNHLLALKYREEANDQRGIAYSYNNIGNTYDNMGNFESALKNHKNCLRIMQRMNDKRGIAASYNNIGNVYTDCKDYPEALKNHIIALKLNQEMGTQVGIANSYNNIGNIFYGQGDYKAALQNTLLALEIRRRMDDKSGMASCFQNIGRAYYELKDYSAAALYCMKALDLAKAITDLETYKEANESLSKIAGATGKFREALQFYKNYIRARDSLMNEENTKKTVRLEMNYEFGKKEAFAKAEQEKKEAIALAESKRQKMVLLLVSCVLLLVAVFAVFAYRSYLQKQKANEAITLQKEIIEQKQKEIVDSIYYARRIQEALLPNERYIERILSRPGKDML